LRFSALGHFHEERELGLLAAFQVVGVDRLRLVRHRDAGAARLQAGLGGLLELTGMEQGPGGQDLVVARQRLGVTGMQARPVLFQRRRCVGVVGRIVRKGFPFGHGVCLLRDQVLL
jgi:hypothetical protein